MGWPSAQVLGVGMPKLKQPVDVADWAKGKGERWMGAWVLMGVEVLKSKQLVARFHDQAPVQQPAVVLRGILSCALGEFISNNSREQQIQLTVVPSVTTETTVSSCCCWSLDCY